MALLFLKQENFHPVPNGMGRAQALSVLEEWIVPRFRADLEEIVKNGLVGQSEAPLSAGLLHLLHQINALPLSATKHLLEQQLRFLLLVIHNRIDQLASYDQLKQTLQIIHQLL